MVVGSFLTRLFSSLFSKFCELNPVVLRTWIAKAMGLLFWALIVGVPLLVVIGVLAEIRPALPVLPLWKSILLVACCIALSVPIGLGVAMIVGVYVFFPLHKMVEHYNGGPFEIGATLEVLVGENRGKLCRVVGHTQSGSVQVELGSESQKGTSEFHSYQVLRRSPKPLYSL